MPRNLDFVTVGMYYSPIEANLAKNALEAEGIKAFLADEETVGMAWLYANAVGGIKVQVAAEYAEQADKILEALGPTADATEEAADAEPQTCEVCGRSFDQDHEHCPHCQPHVKEQFMPHPGTDGLTEEDDALEDSARVAVRKWFYATSIFILFWPFLIPAILLGLGALLWLIRGLLFPH